MNRVVKSKAVSRHSGQAVRRRARVTGQGLLDQLLATAPKLPVRDRAALREQYPGLAPDEIADTLIRTAARATATSGAAVGVWAVLPFIPAFGVRGRRGDSGRGGD